MGPIQLDGMALAELLESGDNAALSGDRRELEEMVIQRATDNLGRDIEELLWPLFEGETPERIRRFRRRIALQLLTEYSKKVRTALRKERAESGTSFLQIIASVDTSGIIDILEQGLGDARPEAALLSAEALSRLRNIHAHDYLLKEVQVSSDGEIRERCLAALSRYDTDSVIACMRGALKSTSSADVFIALQFFNNFTRPMAASQLAELASTTALVFP